MFLSVGFSSIPYNDLIKITDNFDDRPVSEGGCRLGEGGFGTVYKGVLNRKLVAVKKLVPASVAVFPPASDFGFCAWQHMWCHSDGGHLPGGATSPVPPGDPNSESVGFTFSLSFSVCGTHCNIIVRSWWECCVYTLQVKTWELGGHGWIFLWWTVPVCGLPVNGQRFAAEPFGLLGKPPSGYSCAFRYNFTEFLLIP